VLSPKPGPPTSLRALAITQSTGSMHCCHGAGRTDAIRLRLHEHVTTSLRSVHTSRLGSRSPPATGDGRLPDRVLVTPELEIADLIADLRTALPPVTDQARMEQALAGVLARFKAI